jgi:hypothetical protein
MQLPVFYTTRLPFTDSLLFFFSNILQQPLINFTKSVTNNSAPYALNLRMNVTELQETNVELILLVTWLVLKAIYLRAYMNFTLSEYFDRRRWNVKKAYDLCYNKRIIIYLGQVCYVSLWKGLSFEHFDISSIVTWCEFNFRRYLDNRSRWTTEGSEFEFR